MNQPLPDQTGRAVAAIRSASLWTCVGVGLLLRLGWCLHLPSADASLRALPDQLEYLNLARNWLMTGMLCFRDGRFAQTIYAYRTPGYPALIAVCGGSIGVTRIVQAVLDASSILATSLLARRWLPRRASLLAAWIVCVNPMLIYFTGLLLGETMFASLLVWGMYCLSGGEGAKTQRSEKEREADQTKLSFLRVFLRPFASSRSLGFLLLAISVLVRPSALLLPSALAGLSALRYRSMRSAFADGIVALLLTLLILFPWAIRNHERLGAWVWLSTNGGITMYDGFNPAADGSSDQSFVQAMPELLGMTELERDQYFRQKAWTFIQAHPARLMSLTMRKIVRTWSPIPLSESYRTDKRYVTIGACYTVPLFVVVVLSLCGSSLSLPAKVFLLTPAIYITVIHSLTVGSLRYRIPADIPLAVVAAGAIVRRPESKQHASFAE